MWRSVVAVMFAAYASGCLYIMNTNPAHRSITTLVIFCRRPVPGYGKQRIARAIGPELTYELATLLLRTTLEDAEDWPGPVCIAPAAETDRGWAETLPSGGHTVCPQPDGNLGQRLNAVDRALRAAGAEQLIFIGSDAPILDTGYFKWARASLMTHDVVLGAAEDGGVVLMGSRRAWPELGELPWSEDDLGARLELLCVRQGLTVKYLPPRYDIDLEHDRSRLYADLRTDPRPARRSLHDWLAKTGLASDSVN